MRKTNSMYLMRQRLIATDTPKGTKRLMYRQKGEQRHTERHTHSETQTQRDTQRETHTERDTYTERHIHRETHTQRVTHTERHTHKTHKEILQRFLPFLLLHKWILKYGLIVRLKIASRTIVAKDHNFLARYYKFHFVDFGAS